MMNLLFLKAIILSLVWTLGCITYYIFYSVDTTPKTIAISFAPWLAMLAYFIFFWWG